MNISQRLCYQLGPTCKNQITVAGIHSGSDESASRLEGTSSKESILNGKFKQKKLFCQLKNKFVVIIICNFL